MRKVTIIGAGPGNPDLLSRAALDAIDIADVVIGAHRALAGIDVPPDVVRCELVKTADIVAALTDAASWRRAVVVMTGDVGLFSGARRLVEALSGDAQVDVRVIPGISSASYLAARLARPWQDWRFASAHGVACDIVAEAERAGELFLVTSGGEDPSRLSGELVQAGFGDARVTVAEESKTQKAVNTDGLTNEATKHVAEPLQKYQTSPKNEEQAKQQRKPKGPKM